MRWLILIHRWLGIVGCLLFAAWFFSGVVMMYMPFPSLTNTERLERLPRMNVLQVRVTAAEAWARTGQTGSPQRVRLNQPAGHPVYHFLPAKGGWISVAADSGSLLHPVGIGAAMSSAAAHLPNPSARWLETVELDQWSVSSSMHPYRPLHIIALGDEADTELYVSARTGEVVRDTDRLERGWNWVGAVTHWIYPVQLRQHPKLWSDVVIWISIPATVIALTGLVLGVLRYRWTGQFKSGLKTPYRGWTRWHHWLGLLFAITTVTWIFSGLMSMNPWNIFSSKSPDKVQSATWRGGGLALDQPLRIFADVERAAEKNLLAGLREIEWQAFAGETYLLLTGGWNQSVLLHAGSNAVSPQLPRAALETMAAKLMPAANAEFEWLEQYDLYYYAHHTAKALPVLRVKFNDDAATWFHIDPARATLIERYDRSNRVQRWIYYGLHDWDFRMLWDRRPLWDVLLIFFSAGGFALAVTSVVIALRRLGHKMTHRILLLPQRRRHTATAQKE
ncbi:MAG: PepSY domain-containing protein [Burkholderiales bacterium]